MGVRPRTVVREVEDVGLPLDLGRDGGPVDIVVAASVAVDEVRLLVPLGVTRAGDDTGCPVGRVPVRPVVPGLLVGLGDVENVVDVTSLPVFLHGTRGRENTEVRPGTHIGRVEDVVPGQETGEIPVEVHSRRPDPTPRSSRSPLCVGIGLTWDVSRGPYCPLCIEDRDPSSNGDHIT